MYLELQHEHLTHHINKMIKLYERPGHFPQVPTVFHLVRSAAWTLLSCWEMKGGYLWTPQPSRASSHEQPLSLLLWSLIVLGPLLHILPLCSHISPPIWRSVEEGGGGGHKLNEASKATIGLFFFPSFITILMENWSNNPEKLCDHIIVAF